MQQYLPKPSDAGPSTGPAHPEITDSARRGRLLTKALELQATGLSKVGRDDEIILFKAMQICAYMMAHEPTTPVPGARDLTWQGLFQQLADTLVHANLGLVYEMRRRSGVRDVDSDELNSTGMWSLYQAVLGFDPWRGYRFSTYACNVLIRAYRHLWRRDMRQSRHLQNYQAQRMAGVEYRAAADPDAALLRDRLAVALERNAAQLSAVERYVIERRFLNDAEHRPETLATVGKAIRLGKERVRQIQVMALAKLAVALREDPVLRDVRLG